MMWRMLQAKVKALSILDSDSLGLHSPLPLSPFHFALPAFALDCTDLSRVCKVLFVFSRLPSNISEVFFWNWPKFDAFALNIRFWLKFDNLLIRVKTARWTCPFYFIFLSIVFFNICRNHWHRPLCRFVSIFVNFAYFFDCHRFPSIRRVDYRWFLSIQSIFHLGYFILSPNFLM